VRSACRFWISGRVQGVWFRAGTREQALALGLSGYARNLLDGRVEVLAQGDAEAVAALERWLQRGPPLARVERVVAEPCAPEDLDGFSAG
jgi:acylphosphatase